MQTKKLNRVFPKESSAQTEVSLSFKLSGDHLKARFRVTDSEKPNVNPSLDGSKSIWGLWEWDVVELFLQVNPEKKDYFEFQVSPLGQFFELEIFEPRKKWNQDFYSGFKKSASLISGGWAAELEIPLKKLGWEGDPAHIRGNAFAILGPQSQRTYWSLFIKSQEKPDFHLPDEFQNLVVDTD